MNPLIGRIVLFEGAHAGYEGIVLDVVFNGRQTVVTLECTASPHGMPLTNSNPGGARPVVCLYIDSTSSSMLVRPKPGAEVSALRLLVHEYFDASRAYNLHRRTHSDLSFPDVMRDNAKARLDSAYRILQDAIKETP